VREFVGGIAGQAEEQPNSAVRTGPFTFRKDQGHVGEACSTDGSLPGHEFPEHDFMKQRAGEEPAPLGDTELGSRPELVVIPEKNNGAAGTIYAMVTGGGTGAIFAGEGAIPGENFGVYRNNV
jgi:hypothetical protein